MKLSYLPVRRTILAALLVLSGLPATPSSASDSNLTSAQVAAEILRVQAQADATALEWANAQSRSDDLAAEIEAAQVQVAASTAEFDQLQVAMTQIAVSRFTSGSGALIVLEFGVATEDLQRDALRRFALNASEGDLDTIDQVRSDLEQNHASLEALNAENSRLLDELATSTVELEAQLVALAQLREHLKDEEIKRAYEAQLAKKRQEAAKVAAEKAAAEKAAAEKAAAEKAGRTAAPQAGGGTAAVAPKVKTNPSWVCPVAGASAFSDSWGAPRSGGRRHQGVDMMSAFGTPIVAVVAGTAEMKVNQLGGNTVWLNGVDGNSYYYGHLSSWQGSSRSVGAGEVIGYVGATGNTTANHLHFEIHPGGGAAVNPTPTVRQFC